MFLCLKDYDDEISWLFHCCVWDMPFLKYMRWELGHTSGLSWTAETYTTDPSMKMKSLTEFPCFLYTYIKIDSFKSYIDPFELHSHIHTYQTGERQHFLENRTMEQYLSNSKEHYLKNSRWFVETLSLLLPVLDHTIRWNTLAKVYLITRKCIFHFIMLFKISIWNSRNKPEH